MATLGTTFRVDGRHGPLAEGVLTHRHKLMGELVRLYCVKSRRDWRGPPDLTVFFPLSAALRRRLVKKTGAILIPDHLADFPTFRSAHFNPKTGLAESWWCWDGEQEWRHDGSPDQIAHLPYWQAVNDTALIEMLEGVCGSD